MIRELLEFFSVACLASPGKSGEPSGELVRSLKVEIDSVRLPFYTLLFNFFPYSASLLSTIDITNCSKRLAVVIITTSLPFFHDLCGQSQKSYLPQNPNSPHLQICHFRAHR